MSEEEGTKIDGWCIHGEWKGGLCVCEPGKATFFNDKLLTQKYCDLDEAEVALLLGSYPPKHFLHLSAMAFTVVLAVAAFMVLASAAALIAHKFVIRKRIERARRELVEFQEARLQRDGELTVTFWAPPVHFTCISQRGGDSGGLEAKVIVAYNPQNEGELTLKPGMTVTNVEQLQRGWCRGSAGGKAGFFPAAFVEILA